MVASDKVVREGYKMTELGEIPVDWEVKQLKDVVEDFLVPMRDKPKQFDGSIPWCRIEDIEGKYLNDSLSGQRVTEDVISQLRMKVIPKGSVICSCSARLGVCAITTQELTTNQTFIALVPGQTLDKDYLYYLMTSYASRLQSMSSGTTIAYLSRKQFEDLSIVLPIKEEQQKIAEILSTVDEQIENTEQLIEKTKELKKGLMQQLLTKGIGHTEFKQTELGEIPVDWEVSCLKEHVLEFKGGASITPKDFCKEGLKVLPKKCVTTGGKIKLVEEDMTYVSDELRVKFPKAMINHEYLVTTLRDLVPSAPSLGLIVQIDKNVYDFFLLAQGVYGLKLKSTLNEKYLIQLSNTEWYRKEIQKLKVGSTQVHMRNEDFLSLLIPLPSLEEQQKIASILSSVDEQLESYEQEKEKYLELKKGLMQQLLTGKIRVTV